MSPTSTGSIQRHAGASLICVGREGKEVGPGQLENLFAGFWGMGVGQGHLDLPYTW